MNDKLASQKSDVDHTIGDHNVQVYGLDIHKPVFAISAILVVAFVCGTLLFHQQAAVVFGDLRIWITSTFDWFFVITANFLVLFCLGRLCDRWTVARLFLFQSRHASDASLSILPTVW